ncbi:MAG: L-histidine N(alpha)-methyltransferase [Bacteroidales bacterium]|nr:L-histidine N(alpha)-methyltransferase [Bacteroidales bacterium]
MDVNTPLAKTDSEIIEGLTSDPRYIPSKYFYDAKGSVLFQQIMQMPEYYLTNTELDILRQHRDGIIARDDQGVSRLEPH